jgi:hypothetical protein
MAATFSAFMTAMPNKQTMHVMQQQMAGCVIKHAVTSKDKQKKLQVSCVTTPCRVVWTVNVQAFRLRINTKEVSNVSTFTASHSQN